MRRPRGRVGAIVLGLLTAGGARAEPLTLSYRVGIFSSLVLRGMQLSDPDRPVVMASIDVYSPAGWSLGAAVTGLRDATGETASGMTLRARYGLPLDDTLTLAVEGRHDAYHHSAWMRGWCYNQIGAGVTYADQWNLSWNWRPRHGPDCDTASSSPNRALDLNARWPLWTGGGIDAGIGRLSGGGSASYIYGQLGLYGGRGPWALSLGRTWTSGADLGSYGELAKDRWVASLVWQH